MSFINNLNYFCSKDNVYCPRMDSMILDRTINKSSSSNSYWIKALEHDGTEYLPIKPTHHNYNEIKNYPFCGNVIVENMP